MTDLDRLVQVSSESQLIGEFLEWLPEAGYHIAVWDEDGEYLHLAGVPINQLLALYYGIDLQKVEMERRQMLSTIRKVNEKDDERTEA